MPMTQINNQNANQSQLADQAALARQLAKFDLFNGLSEEQLLKIAKVCEPRHFNNGELILRENAPTRELYLILEGEVTVMVRSDDPDIPPIVTLGAGQVFGEIAMVDKGLRSAAVRCQHDNTRLLMLQDQAFLQLCAEDTLLGFLVMRNIAADLAFKLRHRNWTWYWK